MELHADYNDRVKKGQVLVELDSALFQAAVEKAEADKAVALADIENAKASLLLSEMSAKRQTDLERSHFVALADKDTALAEAAAD